ncbi:MAG: bacterio-opsin activator domain-containing protein, partial [Halobacteriaceae archaeon]
AGLLATAAETALDRVAWAQQLQTQKQDAQRQAQQLTRANQINEKLRESIQAIIEADTRQEIEQAICTHLTEIDRFAFAWVGKPTPTGDAVTPVAWAGSNSEYIEDLSGHLDIDSHLPAVQTIREREPTNVSTVADAANQEPWRQLALLHEYQSAISVPIIYEETLYGALTIYATRPSAFDERSTAVLTDVGELVGYAIHVAEQQTAVVATEIVELTFALPTTDEPFVELASRLETEVEILHISARDDGQYLVYVVANDSTASTFRKMVAETGISDDLRVIQERDGNTVVCEMIVSKACIATEIASLTGMADRFVFKAQSNHVTVSLPRTRDIQAFITRIIELYPDATVLNQEITDRTTTRLLPALTEVLTPRQQEVLQTAYYGGFFDQPRHSTGAELADALGISQPAFSKQLRKAEHKLLQVVYESES